MRVLLGAILATVVASNASAQEDCVSPRAWQLTFANKVSWWDPKGLEVMVSEAHSCALKKDQSKANREAWGQTWNWGVLTLELTKQAEQWGEMVGGNRVVSENMRAGPGVSPAP